MIHIGISGPIAVGKSTLAKTLKQLAIESGYAAEIVSFATGVREIASLEEYNDIERRARIVNTFYSWGYDYERSIAAAILADEFMHAYPTTPGQKNRRLLQSIGTEVGRHTINEDVWVYRTKRLLDRRYESSDPLDFGISDDLRFDNEAMAVDVHIAIVVPPEKEHEYEMRCRKYGAVYTYTNHASENSLTLPPLFTIPIGFKERDDVLPLFEKLNRVRKLRG